MSGVQYLVRGAMLSCDKGSSDSKLLLPMSHGFLCKDKPVMLETDCMVGANILPYGLCAVTQGPCLPAIVGKWMKPYQQTKVNNVSAITEESFLVCAVGGLIKPQDSGQ